MPSEIVKLDSIKSVDIVYGDITYPARSISTMDAPDWYYLHHDHSETRKYIQRQFDRVFELVMFSGQLAEDIDNFMATQGQIGAQYANAVLTSKDGQRAAIKDASILYFRGLDITLLGGVFVYVGSELWTQKDFENHEKKLRAIESESPDLARFRHILEE